MTLICPTDSDTKHILRCNLLQRITPFRETAADLNHQRLFLFVINPVQSTTSPPLQNDKRQQPDVPDVVPGQL